MVLSGVPNYGLVYGYSGTVHVKQGELDPIPPLVQGLPYPEAPGDALLSELQQRYCRWHLADNLGPVGQRGPVLSCVFEDPQLARASPSLPRTAVTPQLPDPSTGRVGHTEVALSQLDPSCADALALSQRLAARQPGTDTWRGFSVSSPFLPGGEALMASLSSSCLAAAQQAETGAWLGLLEHHMQQQQQQQQGAAAGACCLPAIAPPGLKRGLFGAWALPEGQRPTEEQLLAAVPATTAAARPAALQQQQAGLAAGASAGGAARLLSAGSAAPAAAPRLGSAAVDHSAAAAAAGGEADDNPEGIFDGLWLLPHEATSEEPDEPQHEADTQAAASPPPAAPPAAAAAAAAAAGAASSALEKIAVLPPPRTMASPGSAGAAAGAAAAAGVSDLGSDGGDVRAGGGADTVDTLLEADGDVVEAGRAAAAALAARPQGPHRAPGDLEFAVRGGIPDLHAAWAGLLPRLALSFPFELDVFQKEAVLHLEQGHSVFVAAHTSAGKTVVAEYAFALAGAHASRAVYTSPIKTISNQKFRDFSSRFEVGLLTGDVQINPAAPCLIMTTEVLRSMLYKGADIIRDIEFVVFDEVHYVNDAERGVVWEEVIIMLPPHITIVMLSATVPNVLDFADWVGRTKNRVVYVSATNKRPVPLEHSVYYAGELYPVMRGDSGFLADGVRRAAAAHKKRSTPDGGGGRGGGSGGGGPGRGALGQGGRGGTGAQGGRGGGRGRGGGGADSFRRQLQGGGGGSSSAERGQLQELLQLLRKRDLLPVAVFTFSKKRCDSAADACSGLDLTTAAEKHTIHGFVQSVLARLHQGDRDLPQILRLRDLMRRGVAVHHAGLLPIMKETVEMLFCQGYIKVLFCTETFAMGVNAPTRTVVFHGLRKHDGRGFRNLLPGEYTQMSGRAGRRGLDAVGVVIIAAWEEPPGEGELKQLLQGKGVSLSSQFRLTYSMILNLLRVEDLKVEDMLRRSFAEFHAQRAQPGKSAALAAGQARLAQYQAAAWPACIKGCSRPDVEEYCRLTQEADRLTQQLQDTLMSNRNIQGLLTPGRVVLLQQPSSGLLQLAVLLGGPDTLAAQLAADSASGGGLGSSKGAGGGKKGLLLERSGVGGSSSNSSSAIGGGSGPERLLWFLALHTPGPLDPPAADTSDGAAAAAAAQCDEDFPGFKLVGRGAAAAAGGRAAANIPGPLPRYGSSAGTPYMVLAAPAKQVTGICKAKLSSGFSALGVLDASAGSRGVGPALLQLRKLQDEAGGGLPPQLDLRSEVKGLDAHIAWDFSEALSKRARLQEQAASLAPHACPGTPAQAALVRSEALLVARLQELNHELSDASLQQMPEFHQRVGVLQQLGYVSPDGTVTLKGRAACEINSTQDELLSTELLFRGLLSGMAPEEAVALMSALVFQEKSDIKPELPPRLAEGWAGLQQLAMQLAELQAAAGLPVAPEEYLRDVLHPGLMQVVYEWARGTPFSAITPLTDVMEGSIVRAVVRLDQCCRELMDAARVMGDTSLFALMEAASGAIRRDIVFAASLYVA